MTFPAANSIHHGDCLDVLRTWPDGCVDAFVTDPPYGLSFMGKRWDYDVPQVPLWREVFRVLKDGGRLLAFSGSRTQHRMVCNIEDAGFTIEDCMMWLYGSGFPKHASKLKPAYEPICVARKGKVTALQIDAARIGTERAIPASLSKCKTPNGVYGDYGSGAAKELDPNMGRWPANVAADEAAAGMLDQQSGTRDPGGFPAARGASAIYGGGNGLPREVGTPEHRMTDSGGASRFFYCAKADSSERNSGCGNLERQQGGGSNMRSDEHAQRNGLATAPVGNHHPTVKPVDLMRWLIRLAVPPGALICDPFAGSGTTAVAANRENVRWVLIEREAQYLPIIRARCAQQGLQFGEESKE